MPALHSPGAALQKCHHHHPPEAPTYLQMASSAPRSPREVQRALLSCIPGVGLVRRLLGNLLAKHSLPESWTGPGLGHPLAWPPSLRRAEAGHTRAWGVSTASSCPVFEELSDPQKALPNLGHLRAGEHSREGRRPGYPVVL